MVIKSTSKMYADFFNITLNKKKHINLWTSKVKTQLQSY